MDGRFFAKMMDAIETIRIDPKYLYLYLIFQNLIQ